MEQSDERKIKQYALDLLEIAECNFLISIYGLKPEEIYKQISPEINHLYWIVGHCVSHWDGVFSFACQGMYCLDEATRHYLRYGSTKEEILAKGPITYQSLIGHFLEISQRAYDFLYNLPEEKFRFPPGANETKPAKESLLCAIQRVALHITGHMGQITMIRRLLGNPTPQGFVSGMSKESRVKTKENWLKWWEENNEYFH